MTAGLDRLIAQVSELPDPDAFDCDVIRLLERRKSLLARCAEMRPSGQPPCGVRGWTHGDVNARNLLWSRGQVVAVLDWDRVRHRRLAAEVASAAQVLFTSPDGPIGLDRVRAFVAGYQAVRPLEHADLADAVHRLWWKRMTSFWPVQFRYERGDRSARIAGLFPPGERLLEWWVTHYGEVMEAFTTGI